MSLWEAYKNEGGKTIENELVKKYMPLITRVCGKHFGKLDFDECYSYGLEAVWLAVRKWKGLGNIDKPEHEFIKFCYNAIWWRINDKMVRTFKTNKRQAYINNIENFEYIVGLLDELESSEEKRERIGGQLRQIFKRHKKQSYELLLKHYGEGIPWEELYKEAGYSDGHSMRESMNQIMDKLQAKAKFLVT